MKTAARALSTLALAASVVGLAAPAASATPPASAKLVTTTSVQAAHFDVAPTPQHVALAQQTARGGVASAQRGTLAQGGFDRDHYWFKISKAEIVAFGVGAVCRWAFGAASWFVCPPITAAVNQAVSRYPNAGGFWGELYTNGQVRAGTW